MEIVEITGYDRASGEITERTLFQLEETKEQPMGVLVRKQELLHVEKLNPGGNCTGKDVRVRLWREIMESGSFPGKRRRN